MDEAKLPKWARDKFQQQRNRISELEGEIAIARREAPIRGSTGKVIADCLGGDGFPIPDQAAVEFKLATGKLTVMLRKEGTVLDINASFGTLCVLPAAANACNITILP